MQGRFGVDFAQVRVHASPVAARSARAVDAHAYTVGNDLVFDRGRYAPSTPAGTRLIAHELAHVVQQRQAQARPRGALRLDSSGEEPAEHAADAVLAGRRAPAVGSARPLGLQRQPNTGTSTGAPAEGSGEPEVEPLHIPIGSGRLSLFPGPGPLSLFGRRFPLPASVRATNALGLGPGPTFVADLDPRHLVFNLLGSVDLQSSTLPGTPEGRESDPANQSRIQLVRPTARLDFSSGRIDGSATLHVPSSYPPAFHPGTDIAVRVSSSIASPMRWSVGASYGPLTLDATVRLHYDTGRLAGAASSGVPELGRELAAPGLSVRGTGRAFGLPVTAFGLEAPTTRPRQRPLLGAPTAFPSTLWAGGVILAPPGSITSVAAPALGFTGASFGEKSGVSGTAALLPTISPSAISAGGPPSSLFPVYAYAEISYVHRVSEGFELGVRGVLQVNSAELLNPPPGLPQPEPGERGAAPGTSSREPPALLPPISPFVGGTIFGRFNAL